MPQKGEGPTLAQCRKQLTRGFKVKLPNGNDGVYLCKLGKNMSWVLDGGMKGPKAAFPTDAIVRATWGIG